MLSFDGSNRAGFNNDGGSSDLWFNQSGDAVIDVDGTKYGSEPIMTWDRGCDNLDESGDGIFPNQNCDRRSSYGGVPGLRLSALRFKNGKMI